ncbi:MAG: hypothetical protein KR126chlam4_00051 [Candidatus Anoxychlamydiales bacterium]|nr:hypothetical protein [Candidatus Anoxychlamydiales bacterium]NGX40234.1 hypothetical protein [Candidatus Anoxychlamydiales bacterium]HEU64120.1 hypothetical protein [Chlamydiota bacterium]
MNFFIFIVSFSSIVFIQAFSIEKDPCMSNDACCEKIEPGPFAFSYPKDTSLECPKNFSMSASFLWMAFYEEGLEYAINVNETTAIQKEKLEFNPGFRVNFSFDRELFYVNIGWTYIRFKDDDFAHPGTDGLLGLFLPPETGSLTGASSRISGDFNTLDMNISKPYHVSRYYISNPKVGIQAAWIDQDYHLRYFTINRKHNVYNKNDFWGVGLEAGYDAEFIMGKNFTFYADVLSALLFSKFDISQIAETLTIYNYQLSDSFYKVIPNAKIGLGFTWSKMFEKKTIKAKLKVGYEFQQWWSINQLRRSMDIDPSAFKVVSKNDLTFNGLVATLHIDI